MKAALGRPGVQLIALLALCALLFGFGLGSGGFIDTEGHRAVPGFEMLDSGNWLVPHMFERPYLRKPPGMPWAVATFAAVMGQTELTARLVSAVATTVSVVAAWWFGRIWFGRWGGLTAGVCFAMTPWFWPLARHAEIEALNQLGTQLAALSLVHIMVMGGRRARLCTFIGALGTVIMLFAKGPAGLAVPAAVMVAACLVQRSARPVLCTRVAAVWLPGLVLFGAWTLAVRTWLGGYSGDPAPITQSPGSFLWSDPVLEIAALPLVAFASALPGSLALLFPWGPDARAEGTRGSEASGANRPGGGVVRLRRGYTVALTLGWAWVISIGVWWAMGIGNPRYTLPAAVLVAPLAGWVVAGLFRLGPGRLAGKRPGIARLMLLGSPAVWPIVLVVGWAGYLFGYEHPRRETSGRDAGLKLATMLYNHPAITIQTSSPITIFADGVIEARPEVPWVLQTKAFDPGVRVVWAPLDGTYFSPQQGFGVLRRDDDLGREAALMGPDRALTGCVHIDSVSFHKYIAALELCPLQPAASERSE